MILFSLMCLGYISVIIFNYTYWQKKDQYKYRKRWNLFFGWPLMIVFALILMVRYRFVAPEDYTPKLAKEFTRTFGLGVNAPKRFTGE